MRDSGHSIPGWVKPHAYPHSCRQIRMSDRIGNSYKPKLPDLASSAGSFFLLAILVLFLASSKALFSSFSCLRFCFRPFTVVSSSSSISCSNGCDSSSSSSGWPCPSSSSSSSWSSASSCLLSDSSSSEPFLAPSSSLCLRARSSSSCFLLEDRPLLLLPLLALVYRVTSPLSFVQQQLVGCLFKNRREQTTTTTTTGMAGAHPNRRCHYEGAM